MIKVFYKKCFDLCFDSFDLTIFRFTIDYLKQGEIILIVSASIYRSVMF